MANFGNFALILALALAAFGTVASFLAAFQAKERFRLAAVRSYILAAVLVFCAVVSLGYLLQIDDFNNVYVYSHSNRHLPGIFKLTAIWGGSQGSLLWWTLILCVYTVIFLFLTKKMPRLMMSWACVIVGLALVFFLIINNFVANPFMVWSQLEPGLAPVPFLPPDGNGLNPQLQHWAMIIHPPLLYTGYIGFLFPFAMALGALITRMEGREWIRLIRRWTLTPWLILAVGIVLGGAWAYMELGWGGYWAWDPVENASFMPWLLATAFIHSVMAQETRGMFKMWNIILLMSTFLMCMFGTFITRSGLISSVHAFAESDIGYYFIAYIVVNALICLWVLLMRRDHLRDDNACDSLLSREVSLLFNNVLFIAICFTMLLATIYPMLTEAIYGTKRELRHGFYNNLEIPIFLGLLMVMAAGPILTWKRTATRHLKERFRWPLVALVVVGSAASLLFPGKWFAIFSIAVLSFLGVTILQEFYTVIGRRMNRAQENPFSALLAVVSRNKRRYGGYIAHFAVLLMGIGLTGAAFNRQGKQEMGVGELMELGPYVFQVAEISTRDTENYFSLEAKVNLLKRGKVAKTFHPEQRFYKASESQASEVSIGISLTRDYYVVLAGYGEGHMEEHPIAVFHVYVNPLVVWIWIGGVLLIFGTFVCMLPERLPETQSVWETMGAEEPA